MQYLNQLCLDWLNLIFMISSLCKFPFWKTFRTENLRVFQELMVDVLSINNLPSFNKSVTRTVISTTEAVVCFHTLANNYMCTKNGLESYGVKHKAQTCFGCLFL